MKDKGLELCSMTLLSLRDTTALSCLVSLPAGRAIGFIPAILEELLDAQANKPECFPARILAGVEERKNQ